MKRERHYDGMRRERLLSFPRKKIVMVMPGTTSSLIEMGKISQIHWIDREER